MNGYWTFFLLTLGSSAASRTQQKPKARRAQRPVGAIPADQCPRHRAGEMVRGNLEVAQRSAAHMALEAQPDLPCLPLRPYLLPSAPHRISTTLTFFFFQFLKYMQLAPASGPLHLLFPLPGRLSSSSSPHSTEVLGQMSPPGTIQSPTQLCPHPLPSHSFYCIALLYLHHSLFH